MMKKSLQSKKQVLNRLLSPVLAFSMTSSPYFSVYAKQAESQSQSDSQKQDQKSSEHEGPNWAPPKDEGKDKGDQVPIEDRMKEHAILQTQYVIQRSLLIATQELVAADRYNARIEEKVAESIKNYSLYIMDPKKVKDLTTAFQSELVKEIYYKDAQTLLNRAHDITTANLARWSEVVGRSNSPFYSHKFSLYDLVKPTVTHFFSQYIYEKAPLLQRMATKKRRLNPRFERTLLNALNQEVSKRVGAVADWHFETGRTSDLKSKKPRRWDSPVEDGKAMISNSTAANSNDGDSPSNKNNARTAESTSEKMEKYTVLLDMKKDKSGSYSRIAGSESYTAVDLEIPSIDTKEVLAQNPETLRYHLRSVETGAKYFGTQFLIFQIPLLFVTMGMVAEDSMSQPMAMDNFINSFSDWKTYAGFGAFILGSHYATRGFNKIVKNPHLRGFGGPLGLAAGFTASTIFGEFAQNKTVQECARSTYTPELKDSTACSKAWNEWMVSDKMSELMPGIASLVATAMAAGLVHEFGTAALKKANAAVNAAKEEVAAASKEASQDLSMVQKGVKDHLETKPHYQKVKETLGQVKETLGKVKESVSKNVANGAKGAKVTGFKSRLEAAQEALRMAQNTYRIKWESAKSFKDTFGVAVDKFKGKLGFRLSGVTALSEEVLRNKVLTSESLGFFGKARKMLFSLSPQGMIGMGLFLAVEPIVGPPWESFAKDVDSTHINVSENLGEINPFSAFFEMGSLVVTGKVAQLPHEKHFKTLDDIFDAYNTSLDSYIANGFQGKDVLSCYKGDASSSNFSHLITAAQNNWKDADVTGLFTETSRKCVAKSDFIPWLEKYSSIMRKKRKDRLEKVENLATQWGGVVSNFTTMYSETKDFYTDLSKAVHFYQLEKQKFGEKATFHPNFLNLENLRNEVSENSNVPLTANRNEDQKLQLENLHPESVGNVLTPELADYLLVSAVCGPDVEQKVSLKQEFTSLSWLPWGDHIKPESPLFDTTSGFQFQFTPPRITSKIAPAALCGGSPQKMVKLDDRRSDGKTYLELLVKYVAENTREDIIKKPAKSSQQGGQSLKIGPTERIPLPTEKLVLDPTTTRFIEWFDYYVGYQYAVAETGVLRSLSKNYHKKMQEMLYPALQSRELFLNLDRLTNASLLEGFRSRELVTPEGVFDSGAVELLTYIRTLRQLGVKLSKVKTLEPEMKKDMADFMKNDFDKMARQFIYSVINTHSASVGSYIQDGKPVDPENKKKAVALFNYSDSVAKLDQLLNAYAEMIPESSPEAMGALYASTAVFDKMKLVLEELDSYRELAVLVDESGVKRPSGEALQKGKMGSPLFK